MTDNNWFDLVEMALEAWEKAHQINQDFIKQIEELVKKWQTEILLNIENPYEKEFLEFLNKNLIWQNEAKVKLAQSLKRLSKLWKEEGVLATYFFAGPTWVGKTEIAKLLAEFLTGDRNNLTIIQWSELQESHYKAKLFWAPPGYAGFWEDPILAESRLFKNKIKNPHPLIKGKQNFQIILFDEVEKTHPSIIQSLLWILNEGKVELQTWKETNVKLKYSRTTDLRNTIWIFTSNVWSFEANKNKIWLIEDKLEKKQIFKEEFENIFTPEFRGRLDEFIVFTHLKQEEIDQIIQLQVNKEQNNLSKFWYNIKIKLNPELIQLIKKISDTTLWARNIVKYTEKVLSDKIAELNSLNYIETAHLLSLKYNKEIIFEFWLKNNHEKYQSIQDKVSIKLIIWNKIIRESKKAKEIKEKTNKYLNILMNPLEELISLREWNKNISALESLNFMKNDIWKYLVYREKYDNFQNHLKRTRDFIEKNFWKNDWNVLSFNWYLELVQTIINEYNFNWDLWEITSPPKEIEILSKLIWEDENVFISKLKNKVKALKKRKYPFEIKETLKLLDLLWINASNIKKKNLVISLITQDIENSFYEKKNYFIWRDRIENIIKYLITIY